MKKIKKIVAAALITIMSGTALCNNISVRAEEQVGITPGSSSGLRVQLYGSNWGLSGKWMNTDMLAVSRTESAKFNLKKAASSMGIYREGIKRVRMDGFIEPDYSEVYTISTNRDEDLKIWIDDILVVNYGVLNPIYLEQGQVHKIEIEMQNDGYNDIKVYWESESRGRQIIPGEKLKTPVEGDQLQENQLSNVNSNPKGDGDGDGIPDGWEKNGFTVVEGILMPYDESIHDVKYVTDSTRRSTDGDPYSDFAEATGIGMDQSVKYPGNNPLIPAYPKVEFVTTSVLVKPSVQNENVESVKDTTGTTNKVSTVTSDIYSEGGFTKGFGSQKSEVGVKWDSDGAKGEWNTGGYYKVEASGGQAENSKNYSTDETKKLDDDLNKQSNVKSDKDVSTVDFTNYAYLQVNGYYKNTGTATAYNVDPIINVSIAEENFAADDEGANEDVVKSFKVVKGQMPNLVGPEMNYPNNGSIGLSLTSTNDNKVPTPIRLTKKQTDKLNAGYPFKIGGTFTSYTSLDSTDEGDRWSSYQVAIDEVCATVKLNLPKALVLERKIYAGNEDNQMNLLDAVKTLYNGKINNDGNLLIDGEEITPSLASEWGIKLIVREEEEYDQIAGMLDGGNLEYSDIILSPGMNVEIYKKDSAKQPNILSAYFNPEDSRIYTVAIPGSTGIESVYGSIRTDEEVEVDIQEDEDNKYQYISEPIDIIDPFYDNKVIFTDNEGNQFEADLYVEKDALKNKSLNGLKYMEYPMQDKKYPFDSYDNLKKTIEYIKEHPEHKFYTVVMGENKRKELTNFQSNTELKIGGTTIYNHAEAQVTRGDKGGLDRTKTPSNENEWYTLSVNSAYPGSGHTIRNIIKSGEDYQIIDKWDNVQGVIGPDNVAHVLGIEGDWSDATNQYDYRNALKVKGHIRAGLDSNAKPWTFPYITLILDGDEDRRSIGARYLGNYYVPSNTDHNSHIYVDYVDFVSVQNPIGEHTQFGIIPRDDILELLEDEEIIGFQNGNALAIEGVFTENKDAQVFIPMMGEYTTLNGGKQAAQFNFDDRAESVMLNIKKRDYEDANLFTLGKTKISLDTGREDDCHQDLVIVDVNDNGKVNKNIEGGKKVDTQMLGYFINKSELGTEETYWQYWAPEKKIGTTILPELRKGNDEEEQIPSLDEALGLKSALPGNDRYMIPYDNISVKGYPVKPKAYILKVDQLGVGTKDFRLTINNTEVAMEAGHKITLRRNNEIEYDNYNKMNHTGYVYVPATGDNPYMLSTSLTTNTGKEEGIQGEVQIEVVGFFYEN